MKARRFRLHTSAFAALLLTAACGGGHSATPSTSTTEAETDCADGADNDGDGVADCDDLDCRATSSNCELAPKLDQTVPTTVWEAAQFLFAGKDPVQKGTSAKAFTKKRIAVLRGKVVDRAGRPLAAVSVRIAGHKEWGYTTTRPDGVFDMAVEGGSQLLVQLSKDGFLAAERGIQAAWRSYENVPEVGLVETGKAATQLSANADHEQVAEGDVVEDALGRRQPIVVFVRDTAASAKLADGSTQELTDLHVRLAEYPFEAPSAESLNAPARFSPGTSPHAGSLSWGVEATIDEAQALEAESVEFSTSASIIVENFLGLPVGSPIPLGYYQRGKGTWQGEQAGRVIEIIGVTGDEADIDVDGDGEAEDDETLTELGIRHGTRRELARRYETGQKLWHIPVSHFSPHSADIATTPPPGAAAPSTTAALVRPIDEPTRHGSLLVERQALAEAFSLGLSGTPYTLRYQSDRSAAYRKGFRIQFPAIGAKIPDGLKRVVVEVEVAGQTLRKTFEPKPKLEASVDWDGKDAFGRIVQGQQNATVTLSYVYDALLRPSVTFGVASTESVDLSAAASGVLALESSLSRQFPVTIGTFDAAGYQLGGLGLDVLHAYDPGTGKIYFGGGDERSSQNVALVTTRPAGDFVLGTPDGVFAAADGSIIVSQDDESRGDLGRLVRIAPDGQVTPLVGEGAVGDAAELILASPQGIAMKADGSIIVADYLLGAIREIAPDGSFRTLVGAADDAYEDVEVVADLRNLDGIALGDRGELYFIDGNQVLKLEGGLLSVFAGSGEEPTGNDVLEAEDAPAGSVALNVPSGIAISPDGRVFISERDGARVRVVSKQGLISTYAGTGVPGFSGDGQQATAAQLSDPRGLAIASDGSLYITDQLNDRIRRVTPDGFIQTVVGGGDAKFREGQLPSQIQLDKPDGIAVSSDGALYVATGDTVYKVAPGISDVKEKDDTLIPSEDGHTLYRFDARGKHLETINAVTGVTELSFGYDELGLLASITDKNGLVTKIDRDSSGLPGTLVGPFGQRTNLDFSDGRLKSITDPLDRVVNLEYNEAGLLSKVVSPEGAERTFKYDVDRDKKGSGALEEVTEPNNYFERFVPSFIENGSSLSIETPLGAASKYTVTQQGAQIHRRFEAADGAVSESTDDFLSLPATFADGSRSFTVFTPDTGFGSQVLLPIADTVTLPSGRTFEVLTQESKELTDPANLLSATRWENTTEIEGRLAKTTYDRRDRKIQVISPLGRAKTMTLDDKGRQLDVDAPGAGSTHFDYDSSGRVVAVTRQAGKETRTKTYTYDDSDGFMRSITDALGQTTAREPDLVGRLLAVTDPSGARFEQNFDRDDRLRSVVLPGSKTHTFDFVGTSSLLSLVSPPQVEPSSVKDPVIGHLRYTYNKQHQPTRVEHADGNSVDYKYDFANRLQSLKTSGVTVTYEYDNAGRVSAVHRSDGPSVSSSFDGPLLTGTTWSGPVEGKWTATYGNDLRLSTVTVNDASTVSFVYDDDGGVVSATGNKQTLSLERSPETGLLGSTKLGTVSSAYDYNGFGELSSLSATFQGAVSFSQELARDTLGRVTQIDEKVGTTSRSTGYTYDAAGRLESVTRGTDVTTYQYDDNGNRTAVLLNGVETVAASYDVQDRLESYGDFTFEQTDHGDLQRRSGPNGSLELAYDGLGNLLSADVSNGKTSKSISYTVDGNGRRVGKQVGGKFARAWLYKDQLRPIAEITSAGEFSHFVYASDAPGGAPDFMLRAGVPYRFVKDHLGSVRFVVNATTGVIAQLLEYDEFGNVTRDTLPGFQPFGFAGGLYDADTGLVRFGARDYDASVGRWMSKDPLLFGGKQGNFYVYAGNDPINGVDLSGLRQWTSEEVEEVLSDYRAVLDTSTFLERYWIMAKLHRGRGPFDFWSNYQEDTFCVRGQEISSADFGNFIAGYAAGYAGDPIAHKAVRDAGNFFGWAGVLNGDGTFTFDQFLWGGDNTRSVLFIEGGAVVGAFDRRTK